MPVADDLVTAAHKRLSAYLPFQALVLTPETLDGYGVGTLIGTDAGVEDSNLLKLSQAWLFQGLDDDGRPFRDPEGSGTSAVVLSETRDWSAPNRHNTATFPSLQMMIYTDSTRTLDGAVVAKDAARKVKYIADILDRCFHLTQNRQEDQLWGSSKWVHSSLRASGREIRSVPGTQDYTVRCLLTYEAITD